MSMFDAIAIEAMARVIAPGAWAVMDDALEATKRKYKGQHVGWPEDQFKHKESLAIAANALNAAEASLRERGKLRDGRCASTDHDKAWHANTTIIRIGEP